MRPRPTALLRAVLVALMLALAGGLPRFVVLCSPGVGAAHVTVTACSHCAHDHGDAHAAAPTAERHEAHGGDGGPGHCFRDDHGTCEHTLLAGPLGPVPDAALPLPPSPAAAGAPAAPTAPLLAQRCVQPQPPATGPPRPDGRTALRVLDVRRE